MTETRQSADEHTEESLGVPMPDSTRRPRLAILGRIKRRRRVPVGKVPGSNTVEDIDIGADGDTPGAAHGEPVPSEPRSMLVRAFSFGVIPVAALLLAVGAGYLKYDDATTRAAERADVESVQAAKDSAIAMLSYTPDTAQAKLSAARDLLTGTFRDSYTALINDVVIRGAKEQQISATATVPAAASVSASATHAVVVVFINQAIVMGNSAPTQTASAVEVTLDKIGNRWFISGFDPK